MANGSTTKRKKKPVKKVIRKRKRRKANTSIGRPRTISGRRRTRSSYMLYYILIALIVMLVFSILSVTVLFKTEEIAIVGGETYSQSEIIRASGITIGDNLFQIKTGKTDNLIETKLPYIEEAQVKRRIPSSVVIEITEAVPTYVVEASSLRMMASKNFKALELLSAEVPSSMTLIKGLEVNTCTVGYKIEFTDKTYAGFLNDTIRALDANGLLVRGIEFTPSGILMLNYQERIIIDMGSPINLDHKVRMAKNVLESEIAVTDSGILYVSGENSTSFRIDTGNLGVEYKINPEPVTGEPETEEEQTQDIG